MKNQIALPSINAPRLSRSGTMTSGWMGHHETMEPVGRAILRLPVKSANAGQGVMLALDGLSLERAAMPHALELCRRNGKRLDILLLNAPKPATLMLGKLLLQLEQEGIDYRLSSGEGVLADELPVYLHRFKSISFVVLNGLDQCDAKLLETVNALSLNGYKVLAHLAHGNASPLLPALAQPLAYGDFTPAVPALRA
jgi:hypothetical protein